jgi:hypothetical protein
VVTVSSKVTATEVAVAQEVEELILVVALLLVVVVAAAVLDFELVDPADMLVAVEVHCESKEPTS